MNERFVELDSLRGIAALSVLIFHTTAANVSFIIPGAVQDFTGILYKDIILFSPLHLLYAGSEAVWLFFLLSGFVLIRMSQSVGFEWLSYFSSRLVRLYLPVIGAVVLTFVIYTAIPKSSTPATDHFLGLVPLTYSIQDMVQDSLLVNGTGFANGPLWSLQWEVLFSLLLPVYLVLAKKFPKLMVVFSFIAIQFSTPLDSSFLRYMPMFMIGSVIGLYWENISRKMTLIYSKGTHYWLRGALMLLIAVVLSSAGFMYSPNSISENISFWGINNLLSLMIISGLALIIIVSLSWNPLKKILNNKALRFLGLISFSLYLTHGPTYIAIAFLIQPGLQSLIIGVFSSLLVAVLFYYLVEKQSHKFARFIAKRIKVVERNSSTK